MLLSVLRSGILQKICDKKSRSPEQILNELLLLLCYIFKRQYVHPEFVNDPKLIKYSSKLILPPLPEYIQQVLDDHNKKSLHTFSLCMKYYASMEEDQLGSASTLPISHFEFSSKNSSSQSGTLMNTLQENSIPFKARSPFTAISGVGDQFTTVTDLARSVRSGIYLDPFAVSVPYVINNEYSLNSYIYEFFTHGNLEIVRKANGIGHGDSWQLLKDFSTILQTITSSLQNYSVTENSVVWAFTSLTDLFTRQFNRLVL